MIIVIAAIIIALACYLMGFCIGKYTAEEDIRRKRDEMAIDEDPEDPWNELFKE